MRKFLLPLVAVLVAASPAAAQTITVAPKLEINITGFSGEPNTLAKAVANIEALSGGRVAAIAYDYVAGTPGYDVVVKQGSNVRFARLDRVTNKAVQISEASLPSWMLNWRTQRRAAVVEDAKVSLADAIRTAEASEKGGAAVAAGIARSASNPTANVHAYMVALRNGDHQRVVAVNTKTGGIIGNPSALTW